MGESIIKSNNENSSNSNMKLNDHDFINKSESKHKHKHKDNQVYNVAKMKNNPPNLNSVHNNYLDEFNLLNSEIDKDVFAFSKSKDVMSTRNNNVNQLNDSNSLSKSSNSNSKSESLNQSKNNTSINLNRESTQSRINMMKYNKGNEDSDIFSKLENEVSTDQLQDCLNSHV